MSRKSNVENARRFLWDEEDSSMTSGRSGRTSQSAGTTQSRGGFSTRDFAVDQSVNLMAMGEDPVRGAAVGAAGGGHSGSSANSSRLAGLFRATTGIEANAGRFDEYGDAAPSADAEEYIASDKRGRIGPVWTACAAAWYSFLDACALLCGRLGGASGRKQRFVLACLLVGLGLLGGGLYVAFRGDGTESGSSNTGDERLNSVIETLVNSNMVPRAVLKSRSPSPQKSAMEWIVEENTIGSDHVAFLDRYALAVFYFSSSNSRTAGWTNEDGWLTEKGICSWYGIECVPREQEATEANNFTPFTRVYDDNAPITVIKLSNNEIEGVLPQEFGLALSNLITLDLQNNHLSHTLPSTLGKLGQLRDLFVRGNQIVGTLPTELSGLSQLHQLHLADNQFEGTIPEDWAALKELRSLAVSHNLLTGSFPDTSKMTHLLNLYLDDNDFEGSLPTYLAELTDLLDLIIGRNNFVGDIAALAGLRNLETLHLDDNDLDGTIPNMFDHVFRLHEILLQGNRFNGPFPRTLTHLQGLKSLDLSNNQLTGTIPEGLGLLSDVKTVFLDNNQFNGPIPSHLGKLDDITHLTLSHNGLTGPIPAELGDCFRLTHLELNSNKLDGKVPTQLGRLSSLKTLHLDANNISGTMPPQICALRDDDLTLLSSDCSKENGKITCECCTECV